MGSFTATGEPSASAGIDLALWDVDGAACADVDNDTDMDLFLSASEGESFLFLNEIPRGSKALRFERDNKNIAVNADGEEVAFGDSDRDGDLELLVNVNGGNIQFWMNQRNDSGADDYLEVRAMRCLPKGRYRDDISATIRLFDQDGETPVGPAREVNGGAAMVRKMLLGSILVFHSTDSVKANRYLCVSSSSKRITNL